MVPPCIVLPWKVLEELDCLKKEQKDQEVKPEREVDLCLRARRAIGEINKFLKNEHPRVMGLVHLFWIDHKLLEVIDPHVVKLLAAGQRKEKGSLDKYFKASTSDDIILQSCLCLREENPSALIILLSNDLNLANKALVHKIHVLSLKALLDNEVPRFPRRTFTPPPLPDSGSSQCGKSEVCICHDFVLDANVSCAIPCKM